MYMKVDRKGIDENDENGKAKCKAIDETKHPYLKRGGWVQSHSREHLIGQKYQGHKTLFDFLEL